MQPAQFQVSVVPLFSTQNSEWPGRVGGCPWGLFVTWSSDLNAMCLEHRLGQQPIR